MGRQVIGVVAGSTDASLGAGIVRPGSAVVGQDAGTVAGGRSLGIVLTDDAARAIDLGDVVLDVSVPAASVAIAELAMERGRPIVVATTGLSKEQLAELRRFSERTAVLVAANLSLGINLIARLLPVIVRALGPEYDVEIVEAHHHFKKDAPSGTAIRLAEAIAAGMERPLADLEKFGRHGIDPRTPGEIGLHALRMGGNAGEHHVYFASEGEEIEIAHRALSRETFARGGVRAARFLAGKPAGWYTMDDVLS
jgi:4-hydroxy-tetrahydrodipicolinate reductase